MPPKVLKLDGPIILDWGNGVRIQLSPVGLDQAPPGKPGPSRAGSTRRPGRKPSPSTQALIDAMEADHTSGKERGRDAYLKVLQQAGYGGSQAAANQILAREAARVFGHGLGRTQRSKQAKPKRKSSKAPGAGRQPSKATVLVREQIQRDADAGLLKDATHYVRWLVHQRGTKIGLKGARPIVYRELRRARTGT